MINYSLNVMTTASRQMTPIGLAISSESSIDQREMVRRLKNREASRKSRQRKVDITEGLTKELLLLKEENMRLREAGVIAESERKMLLDDFNTERRMYHSR